MKGNKNDFFWPSFSDLMTSLFFIMLTLYIITFAQLKRKNRVLENQIKIIKTVEETLKPLKNDTALFTYEDKYSRFKLSFDVRFEDDKSSISSNIDLVNPIATRAKIMDAGKKLKSVIEHLKMAKQNEELDNVSYIVVIAGYASKDNNPKRLVHNYELSYLRALSLWQYWKDIGIDFESSDYKGLVDLQISGNGWGGVGRLANEKDNQRFLIQIFPKIGVIK